MAELLRQSKVKEMLKARKVRASADYIEYLEERVLACMAAIIAQDIQDTKPAKTLNGAYLRQAHTIRAGLNQASHNFRPAKPKPEPKPEPKPVTEVKGYRKGRTCRR